MKFMLILIKRILPFALTLALGIFIASFFVGLSTPKLRFEPRYEYRNECRRSRIIERERLRLEQLNLDLDNMDKLVPPPPIAPAIRFNDFPVKPPVAPIVPRSYR
jgi:hypothetical protein